MFQHCRLPKPGLAGHEQCPAAALKRFPDQAVQRRHDGIPLDHDSGHLLSTTRCGSPGHHRLTRRQATDRHGLGGRHLPVTVVLSSDPQRDPDVPRTEDLLISPESGTTSRHRCRTLAEARP